MTSEQAFDLVSLLVKSYKTVKIEVETVQIYTAMIVDLDFEACKSAVYHLIAESEFFPTIAAIRKATGKVIIKIPSGSEAWAEVKREIRGTGYTGEPKFSSPLIKQAVQGMGGWRSLCIMPDDEWVRKDFIKAYESYSERSFAESLHTPAARQLERQAQARLLNQTKEETPEKIYNLEDYKQMLRDRGYPDKPSQQGAIEL